MQPLPDLHKIARPFLVLAPGLGLSLGAAAYLTGRPQWSGWLWAAATLPVLVALLVEIVTSLRRGDVGLDIVAALSMTAALAFGEYLAGAVVALMYAGGQYLESFAEGRARREMTALLARVPRTAMRRRRGQLEEIPVETIAPGDWLLIRRGDVVPVDGVVADGVAALDQSALTGETSLVRQSLGERVLSGSTNAGDAFDLTASRRAADSTYAGIVRLVEAAQRSKAPASRLADRYAMVFLALTVLAAGAAWIASGDPVRAVAVLVVATPCPLILAVPVAIVSGLSRAAKHGILIKGGKVLETLTRVRSLVIDKTGTLTYGKAQLMATRVMSGYAPDEVLRIAASLDQASKHIIAQTIVEEAQARGLALSAPKDVAESPGEGVEGIVAGRHVVVGGVRFVAARVEGIDALHEGDVHAPGDVLVAVAIDRKPAGLLVLSDAVRTGTATLLNSLRKMGIRRIVLASGDRHEVAEAVTAGLFLDAIKSELAPAEKVDLVLAERTQGPVMMIGDGVNDAPALAAADVGVAMGAKGSAASAEAGDIVLLVDHLDRIAVALQIAQRSRRIALQSVYAGIGLSIAGMVAAGFGHLTPVQGALFQEVIDVAVILNALRALRTG